MFLPRLEPPWLPSAPEGALCLTRPLACEVWPQPAAPCCLSGPALPLFDPWPGRSLCLYTPFHLTGLFPVILQTQLRQQEVSTVTPRAQGQLSPGARGSADGKTVVSPP